MTTGCSIWRNRCSSRSSTRSKRTFRSEVLEAAGFQVVVPSESLCCGRPLYDYGMLDLAKPLLEQILDTLKTYIQIGSARSGRLPGSRTIRIALLRTAAL